MDTPMLMASSAPVNPALDFLTEALEYLSQSEVPAHLAPEMEATLARARAAVAAGDHVGIQQASSDLSGLQLLLAGEVPSVTGRNGVPGAGGVGSEARPSDLFQWPEVPDFLTPRGEGGVSGLFVPTATPPPSGMPDPHPAVRCAALQALSMLRDLDAIPAVRACLTDGCAEVRQVAGQALVALEDEAAEPTSTRLEGQETVSLAGTSQDEATGAWRVPNPEPLRGGSLLQLGTALSDPRWQRREAAVWALTRRGELETLSLLRDRLADPHSRVRAAAVAALQRTATPADVPLLCAWLADPRWEVRAGAVEVLAAIGDPAALPALRAAAGQGEPPFRVEYVAGTAFGLESLTLAELAEVEALMEYVRTHRGQPPAELRSLRLPEAEGDGHSVRTAGLLWVTYRIWPGNVLAVEDIMSEASIRRIQ